MKDSYFSLLLHAHLPYVHHPEFPSYLEENWLYEAISETYIPLLQMLKDFERDKVFCRLALSLSPTLLAMLDHPSLQLRYQQYLQRQIQLCQQLVASWKCTDAERRVLREYQQFYQHNLQLFQSDYRGNIIAALGYYRDCGMLELLCTAATHAFLPNFRQYPRLVRQQIRLAIATFVSYFGRQDSLGFWLPECGYYNGLDKILLQEGVRYCYIALHGLLGSDQLPQNGGFAPVRSPEGLVFFPRERASSAIIWDQKLGFPGARAYRDFYQDVGYRADERVLADFLPLGLRHYTGIKLWRIEQQIGAAGGRHCPYQADQAQSLAQKHAQIFLQHLLGHGRKAAQLMQRAPLISTAYDAELFGHWWFEGPHFLEHLFRGQAAGLQFVTPSEYLAREHNLQHFRPCFSSWGADGYAQVWLDQQNDWVYPQIFELYESIESMLALRTAPRHDYTAYQQEALKQLVREFTLACASDWTFMMKSDVNKDYAISRTNDHIQNTFAILQGLTNKNIDFAWLSKLKKKNRIFLNLDIEPFLL